MSLPNAEEAIQRMKAGSPMDMLELALDMVDECQEVNPQFWRAEGLESLLLFARQLGQEPKFWELGQYSRDPELQECYSKFQWIIGLFGAVAKYSDKCYDFFQGRHGDFLPYLRSCGRTKQGWGHTALFGSHESNGSYEKCQLANNSSEKLGIDEALSGSTQLDWEISRQSLEKRWNLSDLQMDPLT